MPLLKLITTGLAYYYYGGNSAGELPCSECCLWPACISGSGWGAYIILVLACEHGNHSWKPGPAGKAYKTGAHYVAMQNKQDTGYAL